VIIWKQLSLSVHSIVIFKHHLKIHLLIAVMLCTLVVGPIP